jgi:frizzled protein 4
MASSSRRDTKLFTAIALCSFVFVLPAFAHAQQDRCEPIQLELCRDIGYDLTSMPNLIGHENQEDAAVSLETFRPLIKIGCSPHLRIFLCAVHAPMCTHKIDFSIGPCRNLCNSVRSKCLPVLEQFGYTWPVALNCSSFPPENNDMHMCMEGPSSGSNAKESEDNNVFDEQPESPNNDVHVPTSSVHQSPKANGNAKKGIVASGGTGNKEASSHRVSTSKKNHHRSHQAPCSEFRHSKSFVYVNSTGNCAQMCGSDVAFAAEDRSFAQVSFFFFFGFVSCSSAQVRFRFFFPYLPSFLR